MPENKTPKDRTNQFLQEAYDLENPDDMQSFYSNWADEYDTQLNNELGYVSPTKTAALLMRFVADKKANILDIGCGTGLTSVDLANAGYQHIDGLDFSAAMLDKARERNFYSELIQADLTQPLAIADDTYDAALSSGTFTHGHVDAEPLDEIFRIVKPGGYLICTIHSAIFSEHGFDVKIDQLNESGQIHTIETTRDIYFEGGLADGLYYVFRKT